VKIALSIACRREDDACGFWKMSILILL